MPDIWAASAARDHFSEVVDSAVAGRPQSIRRRDGQEVVVVSKEYFEKTKPGLKTFLLTGGFLEEGDDTLDIIYAEARQSLGATLSPPFLRENSDNEDHRYRRSAQLPENQP